MAVVDTDLWTGIPMQDFDYASHLELFAGLSANIQKCVHSVLRRSEISSRQGPIRELGPVLRLPGLVRVWESERKNL